MSVVKKKNRKISEYPTQQIGQQSPPDSPHEAVTKFPTINVSTNGNIQMQPIDTMSGKSPMLSTSDIEVETSSGGNRY